MKKKVLLSSLATIALCISLIAGSTFALFTSESKVNVAVTAGNVEMAATVTNVQKGSTLGAMLNETAVDFDEDTNTITLDKIVPGDYVSFDIVISNQSDVGIQYRTVVKKLLDNGLWKGLEVTIGGVEYTGDIRTSAWQQLTAQSADITIPVTIAFPETRGNEYKGKTCQICYIVEAVQGNAPTASGQELTEAINNATEGSTFVLGASDYGTVSLAGNLKDVTFIGGNDANVIFNVEAGATLDNVTFKNLDLRGYDGTNGSYSGAVNVLAGADVDISFEDCTFEPNSGYAGVRVYEPTAEISFVGCDFVGGRYGVYDSGAPIAKAEFINCNFKNNSSWSVQFNGSGTASVIVFDGCTFENVQGGIIKVLGAPLAGSTLTFTNNTVIGGRGHDGKESEWFSISSVFAITESQNLKDGAEWHPATAEGLGK